MIQTLIEKHKPLNSTEAIDALVFDLESNGIPYSNKLEVEISFEISKLKIQIYLKEHIRTLSRVSSEKFDIQSILKATPIHSKVSLSLSNPVRVNNGNKTFKQEIKEQKKKKKEKKDTSTTYVPIVINLGSTTEIDEFINTHRETLTSQQIRSYLKAVDVITNKNHLQVYLRKELFKLLESVKVKLDPEFSALSKQIAKENARKVLPEPQRAKIYYIPSGGQNKRY